MSIVWEFSQSDLLSLVANDFDGRPAWDGGRYVYHYGMGDPGNGWFARYDIEEDSWTELTGISGIVGAGESETKFASGSTSAVLTEPIRMRDGDLELIVVESTDSTTAAGTPNTPSGWMKIFEETQASGAAGVTTLTIFAKIGVDGEGSVTVDGVGDHLAAQRVLIQDHGVSDVATDIIVGAGNGADTGHGTLTGITTLVDNTLVVMVAVSTRDSSSGTLSGWANANLVGVDEHLEIGTTTGAGGRVAVASGIKGTAGATGNSTVTIAVSDKWRGVHLGIPPASDLYVGRAFHASAVRGGKVYLFAGQEFVNGVSVNVPTTNIYDIASDTWGTDGADMKGYAGGAFVGLENRTSPAAVTIDDDMIYVIAGYGSGGNPPNLNNRADKYDPDTDIWTALPDMAAGTDFVSLTVDSDNLIHSMGGASAEDNNAHLALDPLTDTWLTTLADIPNPDIGHGLPCQMIQPLSLYDPVTDEIVVTVLNNGEALGWEGLTARYHVGTDTWAADITEDLSEITDGFETFPEILTGRDSIGWAHGARRGYQMTQFRLGVGTGIVFYGPLPSPPTSGDTVYYDQLNATTPVPL